MKLSKESFRDSQQVKETNSVNSTESASPLLLTVPQAAQQMGLSPAMIYKLILTDNLPIVKLGRSTRIVYASLVAWLKAREDEQRLS